MRSGVRPYCTEYSGGFSGIIGAQVGIWGFNYHLVGDKTPGRTGLDSVCIHPGTGKPRGRCFWLDLGRL